MDTDDLFEAWRLRRRASEVPPGFADRVMARVAAYEARRRQGALLRLLRIVATSRLARAGLVTLALLLFALRLASVLALFLSSPGIVE